MCRETLKAPTSLLPETPAVTELSEAEFAVALRARDRAYAVPPAVAVLVSTSAFDASAYSWSVPCASVSEVRGDLRSGALAEGPVRARRRSRSVRCRHTE